jgi:hypothetical protein
MTRWTTAAGFALLGVAVICSGCPEEMVGAPCVPETDKGEFNTAATGKTYSIETRSVQCETRICLTRTETIADMTECKASEDLEDCEDTQLKYSFCSCRCKDLEGNTLQSNPDKFDGVLCECPPNTLCEEVLGDIKEAPEKVSGSYCIPNCIAVPCEEGEVCVPSKDSEKPWEWKCKDD